MALIDPPIPKLGVTGAQPATDIVDALEDIRDEINGGLDNDNLAIRCVGGSEWPGERWNITTVTPGVTLASGSTSGAPEGTLFDWQTLLTVPVPSTYPTLREFSVSMTYSKYAQVSGGNNASLELDTHAWMVGPQYSGLVDFFNSTIPGSDGLRTNYSVGLASFTDWGVAGASLVSPEPSMVYPGTDYTGNIYIRARAYGGASFFSGSFRIHSLTFRYRDLEI